MGKTIERFAPGFGDTVLARHITPGSAWAGYNANWADGDILGGTQDWRWRHRPTGGWRAPYCLRDPDLHLCSAASPPGSWVHGLCGWHAARSALHRNCGVRFTLHDLQRVSALVAPDTDPLAQKRPVRVDRIGLLRGGGIRGRTCACRTSGPTELPLLHPAWWTRPARYAVRSLRRRILGPRNPYSSSSSASSPQPTLSQVRRHAGGSTRGVSTGIVAAARGAKCWRWVCIRAASATSGSTAAVAKPLPCIPVDQDQPDCGCPADALSDRAASNCLISFNSP